MTSVTSRPLRRPDQAFRRRPGAGRDRQVGFLVPLMVLLGLTSIVPIVYALSFSLFDWNWGSQLNFVGLENYVQLLGNENFWASLARTGLFTVLAVAIELVAGLLLAVAVHKLSKGAGWIRTLFILPLMVSGMVVSLVWKVMLDPTLGVIPYLVGLLGIQNLDLLGSETTALPALAGIDAWWQTGFVFIILSAGLAALPDEPFEAANVDGATALQRFRFLTLPMMVPIILTVAAIRAVDCLKVFALAFGTTNGGPNQATDFTQLLAYRTAFREFKMSESMTMMITYTLIIILLVAVTFLVREAIAHAK